MNRILFVSLVGTLMACGAESPSGTGGGSGGGGGTSPSFSWAGTWNADVSYTSRCNFAGVTMQQRANQHTVTMQVSGSNDSLTASAQGGTYELSGTGSSSGLTLSGTFPMRDHAGQSATGSSSTQVTFDLTRQGEGASGSIRASFDGSSAFRCEVQGGSITLRR